MEGQRRDEAGSHQFLSIQAQDFIEDAVNDYPELESPRFLSIQAQDFIEESRSKKNRVGGAIPEHSSSGLH